MSARSMLVLVELSIYVSVAIVVVALLRRLLRRIIGAQLAYWIWSLVPACAAVTVLPPPVQSSNTSGDGLSQSLVSVLPAAGLRSIANATTDHASIGLIAWLSVSLIVFAFMVRRQREFVQSLGTLSPAPDGTYRSAEGRGPLLLGILRPRTILPANFETLYHPDEQALILAHEQAHRHRGDTITNAVAALCLCLSWFNPLMYWAVGRLKFDQELACDARVVARAGRRRDYAQALLKTQLAADSASHIPFGCFWQSSHPLKERIVMIKGPLPSLARRLCGVFMVGAVIAGCSYTAWNAQAEPGRRAAPQSQIQVSAEQMSTAVGGVVSSTGNIVVSGARERAPWTIRAATLKQLDNGAVEATGAVRLSRKGMTITTDRAIIRKDGTVEMEQASISTQPRANIK